MCNVILYLLVTSFLRMYIQCLMFCVVLCCIYCTDYIPDNIAKAARIASTARRNMVRAENIKQTIIGPKSIFSCGIKVNITESYSQ